ncbi:hypothetical protein ACLIBG_03630 [Virgibacillus sp. W0181]|uniref:hypothetical protein n=1 Tax=Virgibacillus sp. W0181 TaxID=3391581 RepID=UPI003F46F5D4
MKETNKRVDRLEIGFNEVKKELTEIRSDMQEMKLELKQDIRKIDLNFRTVAKDLLKCDRI